MVTAAQMDVVCRASTTGRSSTPCFSLFDRSPHAWAAVDRWAAADEEFVKRAGFALLWSLASGHDRTAPDGRFAAGLALIQRTGGDGRRLVRQGDRHGVAGRRQAPPGAAGRARAVAERMAASDDPATRRIGRPRSGCPGPDRPERASRPRADPCGQRPGSDFGRGRRWSTRSAISTRSWAIESQCAHGHGLVVQRVEVDGHAERRAELVLPAVAAADGLGLVVVAHPVRLERGQHLVGQACSSGFFDSGSTATL